MTNDSYVFAPQTSGHYALHCNDLNFQKYEKIVI